MHGSDPCYVWSGKVGCEAGADYSRGSSLDNRDCTHIRLTQRLVSFSNQSIAIRLLAISVASALCIASLPCCLSTFLSLLLAAINKDWCASMFMMRGTHDRPT